MRQPFDFGVQAFASEAVSACNFLGQPTLFMCQTSFISTRVNKTRNWFPMNFETSSNFFGLGPSGLERRAWEVSPPT